MKIFFIECTEDELRANRGIMDAIVDACSGLLGGIYGSYTPCREESDADDPNCDADMAADMAAGEGEHDDT